MLINFLQEHISLFHRPMIIAIDGRSGTGKSTLAQHLAKKFYASCIEQDAFFSGGTNNYWKGLSLDRRYNEVISWQRLKNEVLKPLKNNQQSQWYCFDFTTWQKSIIPIITSPAPLVIVEGAYSSRPEILDMYDLTILVELSDTQRRKRLIHREGINYMQAWHAIWDEVEDNYFKNIRSSEKFDIVFCEDII